MRDMGVTESALRLGEFEPKNASFAANPSAPLGVAGNVTPLEAIRKTMLALVRQDGRDLTARQMTTLLSIYLTDETHTVTSLATMLNVSRPGVTRILDRLVDADLVSRAEDSQDRRRVLIRRTREGQLYVEQLASVAAKAAQDLH